MQSLGAAAAFRLLLVVVVKGRNAGLWCVTLEAVEVRSLVRTLKMLIVPSLVLLKLQVASLIFGIRPAGRRFTCRIAPAGPPVGIAHRNCQHPAARFMAGGVPAEERRVADAAMPFA